MADLLGEQDMEDMQQAYAFQLEASRKAQDAAAKQMEAAM